MRATDTLPLGANRASARPRRIPTAPTQITICIDSYPGGPARAWPIWPSRGRGHAGHARRATVSITSGAAVPAVVSRYPSEKARLRRGLRRPQALAIGPPTTGTSNDSMARARSASSTRETLVEKVEMLSRGIPSSYGANIAETTPVSSKANDLPQRRNGRHLAAGEPTHAGHGDDVRVGTQRCGAVGVGMGNA